VGNNMVSEGRGRLFRRKDGKYLIYVPKDLAEDSMFPFKTKTSVKLKIYFKSGDNKLIVEGQLMTFHSSFFFTPDFIMYNPISRKTTPPTINGTKPLRNSIRFVGYMTTATIHNVPKRPTEAKPRIIKPIQNIIVFSPSNTLNHHNKQVLLIR